MRSTQKMVWPNQCIYTTCNLGLCHSDFSITTASRGFEQQRLETWPLLLVMVLFSGYKDLKKNTMDYFQQDYDCLE